MAISYGDLGTLGSGDGSDAFRRSPHGAAVFEVSAAQRPRVLEWARGQRVPHAARRPVHTPSVDAWAVLDGGVVHLYGYGLTTLPAGVHVVGLQAFRLILAELGFPVPDGLTEASTSRARSAGPAREEPGDRSVHDRAGRAAGHLHRRDHAALRGDDPAGRVRHLGVGRPLRNTLSGLRPPQPAATPGTATPVPPAAGAARAPARRSGTGSAGRGRPCTRSTRTAPA